MSLEGNPFIPLERLNVFFRPCHESTQSLKVMLLPYLLHWWHFCRARKSSNLTSPLCVGYQECTRRRMVSGTSPSLPYVCRYDTVEDIIQRREKILEKTKGEQTSSAGLTFAALTLTATFSLPLSFPVSSVPTPSVLSAAEQKKKTSSLQTFPGSSYASSFVCCSSQAPLYDSSL